MRRTDFTNPIININENDGSNFGMTTKYFDHVFIDIYRKKIIYKSHFRSTLIHELGYFVMPFNTGQNDLAAILHETHKQHLGRIFPNLDHCLLRNL